MKKNIFGAGCGNPSCISGQHGFCYDRINARLFAGIFHPGQAFGVEEPDRADGRSRLIADICNLANNFPALVNLTGIGFTHHYRICRNRFLPL